MFTFYLEGEVVNGDYIVMARFTTEEKVRDKPNMETLSSGVVATSTPRLEMMLRGLWNFADDDGRCEIEDLAQEIVSISMAPRAIANYLSREEIQKILDSYDSLRMKPPTTP